MPLHLWIITPLVLKVQQQLKNKKSELPDCWCIKLDLLLKFRFILERPLLSGTPVMPTTILWCFICAGNNISVHGDTEQRLCPLLSTIKPGGKYPGFRHCPQSAPGAGGICQVCCSHQTPIAVISTGKTPSHGQKDNPLLAESVQVLRTDKAEYHLYHRWCDLQSPKLKWTCG